MDYLKRFYDGLGEQKRDLKSIHSDLELVQRLLHRIGHYKNLEDARTEIKLHLVMMNAVLTENQERLLETNRQIESNYNTICDEYWGTQVQDGAPLL